MDRNPQLPSSAARITRRTATTITVADLNGSRVICDHHQNGSTVIGEELRRGGVVSGQKHVAMKRSKGATIGSSRGVKIPDTEEMDLRKLSKKYNCPPSPEIGKVQEALKTSVSELQEVVKYSFFEALRPCMGGQNMNQESSVKAQKGKYLDAANPSVGTSPEAALANEDNYANLRSRHQNDVPKPSSMGRNGTARTLEWDDSIDSLPEGSADHASRPHLSTRRRRLVSPLKKYESPKVSRRRRKKWSTLEEDTLRTGGQKLGMGNWKLILNTYHEIFIERTQVDLKDKWRNMTRYQHH